MRKNAIRTVLAAGVAVLFFTMAPAGDLLAATCMDLPARDQKRCKSMHKAVNKFCKTKPISCADMDEPTVRGLKARRNQGKKCWEARKAMQELFREHNMADRNHEEEVKKYYKLYNECNMKLKELGKKKKKK